MSLPQHIKEALEKRRNKYIFEMYKDGFQMIEIAALFNISKGRVSQIIKESELINT